MRASISIVIAVLCAIAHPAFGQSPEAEALFRDGKKLVKEGKLAEGCAKLEASERIETSTGTLLNLGDCREQNKQLASAWAAFVKATTSAKAIKDKTREGEARRRAKSLESRYGKLVIAVKTKVDGLTITKNDANVDSALWNTESPVDAGTYQIAASAPGYETWKGSVKATDGATVTVDIPALDRTTTSKSKPSKPSKPVEEEPTGSSTGGVGSPPIFDAPVDNSPGMFSTTSRKISVGLAVVGLVGIGLGVKFGLDANDEHDRANKICPTEACTDPKAVDLNDDAQGHATLANVSFVVGGAAVVGAVVLWFVGKPKEQSKPFVELSAMPTEDGGTFVLGGRF